MFVSVRSPSVIEHESFDRCSIRFLGCLENENRRPKTKDLEKEDPLENEDLEKEDPLENEDLENEDPLENEDLEKEDPLENEDLENEDPLEKHENTKQKIEAESSLAYLQISKMAETWPGVSLASLQVPVLFSDKRAQNK